MTDAELRAAYMAHAMGVPAPSNQPMIGPPAGPLPPPGPEAFAAPPAPKPKPSLFGDRGDFGGVDPADVDAATAELEASNARPSVRERLAALPTGTTMSELGRAVVGPTAPTAAPAGPGSMPNERVDPSTIKFAPPKEGGHVRPDASAPSINWGGAGGGPTTIAAHEQALASPERQKALLGAVDAEGKAVEGQKAAARDSGDAAADVERQKAIGERDVATATEDAGVDTKLRAQLRNDELKSYRKHIDDFSAKVAKEKIDPNGMWNNASTGQKITWTLAKAFGAVGQAFLHTSSNQVADHIDQMAAQDVAAQRANHETNRERVGDMNSMYAQALHATGNAEEAERVATGYALEAARHNALALSTNATGAVQKARGAEIVAALDEKQAQLGEKKAKEEIALNPLVQARTVGVGLDMNKVYAGARQRIEDQAKLGTVVSPDEAIRWSYKLHTGRDPLPGAGQFAGGAKAEPGSKAEKVDEARTEVNGGIATLDRALDSGVAFKQGPIGALWSHVPGATDSKKDALERDAYNAQVKALVGAGWKLVTNGMEPKNPGIIEELSGHYQLEPSDSPELARAKITRLQQTLRDAGGSKGVIFDAAQSGDVKPPTFAK
jgi:hypothetical protein